MAEIKKLVTSSRVSLQCDFCSTVMILDINNPEVCPYHYICPACNHTITSLLIYPYITFE